MKTFQSKFGIGDKVWIDGEGAISATVTCVAFRSNGYIVCSCDYFHNGVATTASIEEWRLTPEPKR